MIIPKITRENLLRFDTMNFTKLETLNLGINNTA